MIGYGDGTPPPKARTTGSTCRLGLNASTPHLGRSKHRVDRPAKVPIIDDDEGVPHVLFKIMEVLRHHMVAAKEGGGAIELYAKADAAGEQFDVVIMDLNIPRTGRQVDHKAAPGKVCPGQRHRLQRLLERPDNRELH